MKKDMFILLGLALAAVGLVVVIQNLPKILWNLTTPIVEAVR